MDRLKIKKRILNSTLVLLLTLLVLPSLVVAQQETPYKLLAPLPCVGDNCGSLTEETVLSQYLPGIFKLAVGLSAAFAVLMIVIGGFQYMSTDAFQGKEEGKHRVTNAVKGLVLIIGAALILIEINPDLLKLRLTLSPVSIQTPTGGGPGGGGTLQPVTQAAWNDLVAQCQGCNLTKTSTTGGRHDPNSLHYRGLAIDIAPNTGLNQFLTGSNNNPAKECYTERKTLGGTTVTFLWEPKGADCGGKVASSGDHWHMSIQE